VNSNQTRLDERRVFSYNFETMKTFLLAWNPNRWIWNNIAEMSENVKMGEVVHDRWSSGVSKQQQKGDRFFLIRLGEEPRGIFASGSIVKDSFEDLHWDEEKSSQGKTTNYVEIKYDTLLNPNIDTILPRDFLNTPPLSEMHWDTQMSGVQIPDNIATQLEQIWANLRNPTFFTFPEDVDQPQEEMFEGAVRRVIVNAYERNPEARRQCINHYGAKCSICEFDFFKVYGDVGKDFIHVHHLKQISEIGATYKINPIEDLRPVCPNCHAVLHKRTPPYTIDEVKGFLRK